MGPGLFHGVNQKAAGSSSPFPAGTSCTGSASTAPSPVPVCSLGAGAAAAPPCRDAGDAEDAEDAAGPSAARPLPSPRAGSAVCPQPRSSPFRALFSLSSLLIWERILRMSCSRCGFPSMLPARGAAPRPGHTLPLKPRHKAGRIPALGAGPSCRAAKVWP